MVLHHPMVGLTDVGLEQDRSDICVVGRPQRIAYVMQQRTDDIFFVFTVFVSQSRCLQTVGESINGKTTAVAFEQQQMINNSLVQRFGKLLHLGTNNGPILERSIFHVVEFCAFRNSCIHFLFSSIALKHFKSHLMMVD